MTYPTNQIPTVNPQNITVAAPVGLQSTNRNPTAQDNTFPPGWEWQNTVTGHFFKCVSATISGAVWTPFIPSSAGTVSTLTANSGGMVGPDGSGNINVVGDGTTINIVGNPGTNTLTASLVGGTVAAESFVTNVSGPVVPTSSGIIDLNASTSTYTDGGTANTIKTEVQGTNHAVFIGKGVHTPASTIAVGSNGQVIVGATGADPAFATLTSSASTITYTTGANSLNLDVTPAVLSSFTPVLSFGGASVGLTYTSQAFYYQLGALVFFDVLISLTNKGSSSGNAAIKWTAPPPTTGVNGVAYTFSVAAWQNITLSGGATSIYGFMVPSTAEIAFGQSGSGVGNVALTDANFANNSIIGFNGWYGTN